MARLPAMAVLTLGGAVAMGVMFMIMNSVHTHDAVIATRAVAVAPAGVPSTPSQAVPAPKEPSFYRAHRRSDHLQAVITPFASLEGTGAPVHRARKPSVLQCADVSEVCGMEKAGRYEAAFQHHVQRGADCGLKPWYSLGKVLGKGLTGRVDQATTPCGTPFVVKGALVSENMGELTRDCSMLKHLQQPALTGNADYGCDGCVPQYYGYDGAWCYSELVTAAVSVPKFVRDVVLNYTRGDVLPAFVASPATQLSVVKEVVRQGLDLLRLLRDAGVVHNDVLVRNMLVRRYNTERFQLAFIDFCNAQTADEPNTNAAKWGCVATTYDLFSFGCVMIDSLFIPKGRLSFGWRQRGECVSPLPGVVGQTGPGGPKDVKWTFHLPTHYLEYVLWRMVAPVDDGRVTSLDQLYDLLDGVTAMNMTAVLPHQVK